MDDPLVFRAFLQNAVNITTVRTLNAITAFLPTLRDLLTTTDDEITAFVTTTHNSNSARANNAKILIPVHFAISLQALLFELKDRDLCNALPTAPVIQAITTADLNALCRSCAEAIEHRKQRKENKDKRT